jgi:hypothetical protein
MATFWTEVCAYFANPGRAADFYLRRQLSYGNNPETQKRERKMRNIAR